MPKFRHAKKRLISQPLNYEIHYSVWKEPEDVKGNAVEDKPRPRFQHLDHLPYFLRVCFSYLFRRFANRCDESISDIAIDRTTINVAPPNVRVVLRPKALAAIP